MDFNGVPKVKIITITFIVIIIQNFKKMIGLTLKVFSQ